MALLTGGTYGIGLAVAKKIVSRRYNLVLVPRSSQALHDVITTLSRAHGVLIRLVSLDLARADLMNIIFDATQDLDIGLLV